MEIKTIIERGEQLSPRLLEQLDKPIALNPENPYESLAAIMLLMDLISKLGWVEHTSDWDIGAFIFLKNGDKIEVPQGYGDCLSLHREDGQEMPLQDLGYWIIADTIDFTLQLTEANADTDDVKPFSINIWAIQAIQFFS